MFYVYQWAIGYWMFDTAPNFSNDMNLSLNDINLNILRIGALRLSPESVVFSTYLCLDSLQPMAQKKHLSM